MADVTDDVTTLRPSFFHVVTLAVTTPTHARVCVCVRVCVCLFSSLRESPQGRKLEEIHVTSLMNLTEFANLTVKGSQACPVALNASFPFQKESPGKVSLIC